MLWLPLSLAVLSLWTVTVGKPIYAFLGEEIVLECSHGIVWYEEGFGPIAIYYVREGRADIRKYEDLIQVNRSHGTFTLRVPRMDATLDSKKFICCKQSAACPNPVTAIVSYRLRLASVSDPMVELLDGADDALESVEKVVHIFPKETLTVSCLLPALSSPHGDVTIRLTNSHSGQELEQRSSGNISLTFRPTTSSLNGTVISCESQNDVGRQKHVPSRKSESYLIVVCHVDTPTISVTGDAIQQAGPSLWAVKEDSSLQLTCEADCYPQCRYEWQCDDSLDERRMNSQLVIDHFSPSLANCTCRASVSSSRGVWLESASVELKASPQAVVFHVADKITGNDAAAAAPGCWWCLAVFLALLYDHRGHFLSLL